MAGEFDSVHASRSPVGWLTECSPTASGTASGPLSSGSKNHIFMADARPTHVSSLQRPPLKAMEGRAAQSRASLEASPSEAAARRSAPRKLYIGGF